MKHVTDDEFTLRVLKIYPQLRPIYDDDVLSMIEMKVKINEIWMLYFLGTNYQEKYCTDYLEQLMELIQEILNETLNTR